MLLASGVVDRGICRAVANERSSRISCEQVVGFIVGMAGMKTANSLSNNGFCGLIGGGSGTIVRYCQHLQNQ